MVQADFVEALHPRSRAKRPQMTPGLRPQAPPASPLPRAYAPPISLIDPDEVPRRGPAADRD